ncbi:unnamed protein product [Natator depressus]
MTWQSHLVQVASALQSLQEVELTTNPKECKFGMQVSCYLRYFIDSLDQQPDLWCLDFSFMFILQTDASTVGLGAALSQNFQGVEYPILYLNWKLQHQETR